MSETGRPAPNQTLPEAADPAVVDGGRPSSFPVRLGYAVYVKNLSVIQILPVAAFVAAAVYLTDVRPKVKQIGSGGSSGTHMGPYGPW